MWTKVVTTDKTVMNLRASVYSSFLKLGLEFLQIYSSKHELPLWNSILPIEVSIKMVLTSEHLLLNQRILMC